MGTIAKIRHETVIEPESTSKSIKKRSISQLADELGELHRKKVALLADPVFTRYDEIESEIRDRVNEGYDPESEIRIRSKHWTINVGPAFKQPRKIKDIEKLRKLLGDPLFMRLVNVNVTEVEVYIPEEERAKLIIDPGYTERRHFKFRPRM